MDAQLKQRLVGAAVLGLVAIVGIPLILGEPQRRGTPEGAEAAPRPIPETGFNSRIQPLTDPSPPPPVPSTEPDSGSPTSVVVVPSVAPATAPTAAPPSPPAGAAVPRVRPQPRPSTLAGRTPSTTPSTTPATTAPVAAPAPSAAQGRFLVQLASFSSAENALKLRDALRAKGHPASVVASEDRVHHRLFVGPFRDRTEADQAIVRLRAATGLTGVVRRPGGS